MKVCTGRHCCEADLPGLNLLSGIKEVVKRFLGMGRVFKTKIFDDKFDVKAKGNLLTEFKFF